MIPDLLHPVLVEATHGLLPAGAVVEPLLPAANVAHGDYQWNGCMKAAKGMGTAPRVLAAQVQARLTHPALRAVEVAGPGFLNLRLDDAWLASVVAKQAADPNAGVAPDGAGRTVILDYSSPNVAKRMHIGHMRSTHIGSALDRLHRAAGWTVVADNHIGDWGTQFGKLIVAWRRWRDDAAFADDPVGELERLYVRFVAVADDDPKLADQAREETAKLQRKDPDNTALWRLFLDVSMKEYEGVYRRMGVRFDEVLGESAYADRTDAVVDRLVALGIAEPSEGATIVRFGEKEVMIVRKRDGADNYATTDLACALYRKERWSPARVVYVTDGRQQLHFKQVFHVARQLGVTADLVHAWFGTLLLPEGAMSTRRGNVIRLVDLLDEAVRRARAVVDQKSPQLADDVRAHIAEAVGVGAVRYADLSQHPQTNVVFDWERMLSLEGNTAPYLMYSHARCCSLLARAAGEGDTVDPAAVAITDPVERDLALALVRYPEVVAAALVTMRPNLVTDHLFDLANRLNRFWHDMPVLTGGEHRASRLALVDATRRVLKHGIESIGLVALERM